MSRKDVLEFNVEETECIKEQKVLKIEPYFGNPKTGSFEACAKKTG